MATDLITKLEEAGEGSRGLDALVHVEVANDPNTFVANSVFSFRDGWYCTGADMVCLADPVTTSLDAALALASRVLPEGRHIGLQQNRWTDPETQKLRRWTCFIEWTEDGENFEISPTAQTPALALCAAILRASEEKQS